MNGLLVGEISPLGMVLRERDGSDSPNNLTLSSNVASPTFVLVYNKSIRLPHDRIENQPYIFISTFIKIQLLVIFEYLCGNYT